MNNIEKSRFIPPALQEAMTEFDMTLNDIDKLSFEEFKEFCAQLELKPLKQLRARVINEFWQIHIDNILDKVAFLENYKFG